MNKTACARCSPGQADSTSSPSNDLSSGVVSRALCGVGMFRSILTSDQEFKGG